MLERLFIKTFGCQMNEYESVRIAKLLAENGVLSAASYDQASIIILNTCTVRQKAEDKIYSELGRLKKYKTRDPDLLLGIGGCLAQQEGTRLFKQFPYLDFVFGTKALPRLNDIVAAARKGLKIADIEMNEACQSFYADHHYAPDPNQVSAFVTIMQGCDNFCSYCIVPHVRGREWSRSLKEILQEVRSLVDGGVREVTLLGQNVNSYGKHHVPTITFTDLVYELNIIDRLERIRFTTSHPKDLSPDLIAAFKNVPKLCEHIHLPLQSGSDRILKHMNRQYTQQLYYDKILQLRATVPEIAITSDIIVGYPGETEEEYAQTAALINKIQFDDLFIFHYTDRKGTKASELPDSIPYSVKIERLEKLNELQRDISLQKNMACIGTRAEVLFESTSKKGSGCISGRTRTAKVVNCPGPVSQIGQLSKVIIEQAHMHSLTGTLAKGD